MKYYYFHGFNANYPAKKCLIMQGVLGSTNVKAPNFNVGTLAELDKMLQSLIREIKKNASNTCIVGSSLGGLYALYVSAFSGAKCVLLNPCLFPQLIIPSLQTDIPLEHVLFVQHLSLKAYEFYDPDNVRVWVTTNDELINHKYYTKPFFNRGFVEYIKFPKKEAADHSFKGFKKVFTKYF